MNPLKCLIYKNTLDIVLFAHMRALILQGVSQEKAYFDFIEKYNVSAEEVTFDKAKMTYYRITKDIINK